MKRRASADSGRGQGGGSSGGEGGSGGTTRQQPSRAAVAKPAFNKGDKVIVVTKDGPDHTRSLRDAVIVQVDYHSVQRVRTTVYRIQYTGASKTLGTVVVPADQVLKPTPEVRKEQADLEKAASKASSTSTAAGAADAGAASPPPEQAEEDSDAADGGEAAADEQEHGDASDVNDSGDDHDSSENEEDAGSGSGQGGSGSATESKPVLASRTLLSLLHLQLLRAALGRVPQTGEVADEEDALDTLEELREMLGDVLNAATWPEKGLRVLRALVDEAIDAPIVKDKKGALETSKRDLAVASEAVRKAKDALAKALKKGRVPPPEEEPAQWAQLTHQAELTELIESLDARGIRESALKRSLEGQLEKLMAGLGKPMNQDRAEILGHLEMELLGIEDQRRLQ
ncbi:hypothetical protein JKP88DRAFT_290020 [Tribonema minus]|uniref:WHIM2 domain-containing protein n=1 Tax=Tribonema minus TaxID=303371 RepID=A0A835YZH7_9STRA|nr:hypothetical protein JKP88DRAFT_290020 [Tribonema minus]